MTDLKDIHIPWLIGEIKKKRDTTLLIHHLRDGRKITPALALLIADLLEGKIKARPKQKKLKKWWIKIEFDGLKEMLRGNSGQKWRDIAAVLENVGYRGDLETKGEITCAAEMCLCHLHGLTKYQLDELLRPRAARKKNT